MSTGGEPLQIMAERVHRTGGPIPSLNPSDFFPFILKENVAQYFVTKSTQNILHQLIFSSR